MITQLKKSRTFCIVSAFVFCAITFTTLSLSREYQQKEQQRQRQQRQISNNNNNNNNNESKDQDNNATASFSPLFSNYCPPPAVHIIEKPCKVKTRHVEVGDGTVGRKGHGDEEEEDRKPESAEGSIENGRQR